MTFPYARDVVRKDATGVCLLTLTWHTAWLTTDTPSPDVRGHPVPLPLPLGLIVFSPHPEGQESATMERRAVNTSIRAHDYVVLHVFLSPSSHSLEL